MSKRWYVLHARSGYEAKVKTAIEDAVAREGLEDLISEVMVPTEQVVELKDGQKKTAERKFFPGYMLISMELTEPSWLLVKNTSNVIGFIGGHLASLPLLHNVKQIESWLVFKRVLTSLNLKLLINQAKKSWLLMGRLMNLTELLKRWIMTRVF